MNEATQTSVLLPALFFFLLQWQETLSYVPFPPKIMVQPSKELFLRKDVTTSIDCKAIGYPKPRIEWKKNGQVIRPENWNKRFATSDGSLLIFNAMASDSGFYQCYAINEHGTAVSTVSYVRLAELRNFPVNQNQVISHTINAGSSLTLECNPPKSIPDSIVYWTINRIDQPSYNNNKNKLNTLQSGNLVPTGRISQDPLGNLHFSNILSVDGGPHKRYQCNSYNPEINVIRRGPEHSIIVLETDLMTTGAKAERLWVPPLNQQFMRDSTVRLKCIFGGKPTPKVVWRRLDGYDYQTIVRSNDRSDTGSNQRLTLDSDGQELIIGNVQLNDTGVYECRGLNEQGMALSTVKVSVQTEPQWTSDWSMRQTDHMAAENDTVIFVCDTFAVPPADPVVWYRNGVRMPGELQSPSINLSLPTDFEYSRNSLIIRRVREEHTGVYQCNATNSRGYAFENFRLSVMSQSPEAAEMVEMTTKFLSTREGNDVTLNCSFLASPKPEVRWSKNTKNSRQILDNGSYSIVESLGVYKYSLRLNNISLSDSGLYTCQAVNKLGSKSQQVSLDVRRRMKLDVKPRYQKIVKGTRMQMVCEVVADGPVEVVFEWYKDGFEIDPFLVATAISRTSDGRGGPQESTYFVESSRFSDSGTYSCVAHDGGLNRATGDTVAIVYDRPNMPILDNLHCYDGQSTIDGRFLPVPRAHVSWSSTGDNNAMLLHYNLQYNTAFNNSAWTTVEVITAEDVSAAELVKTNNNNNYNNNNDVAGVAARNTSVNVSLQAITTVLISPTQTDLWVNLSCWAKYSFRVIAFNEIGQSDPSAASQQTCSTKTCPPWNHPRNVRSGPAEPHTLVIEWEPMNKIEWNDPDFWYMVTYRMDAPGHEWSIPKRVENIINSFTVNDTHIYTKYEFKVKACNNEARNMDKHKDMIHIIPEPVVHIGYSGEKVPDLIPRRLRVDTFIDGDSAEFSWQAVSNADDVKRVGGRLKGFLLTYANTKCLKNCTRTRFVYGNRSKALVTDLPAWADVSATIAVANDRYIGNMSTPINFKTPEGRPGIVRNVRAMPFGPTGIKVRWDDTEDPSGNILGYLIQFHTLKSQKQHPLFLPEHTINDPSVTVFLQSGFMSQATYEVELRAFTSRGHSKRPALAIVRVGMPTAPAKPKDVLVDTTQPTFVNVSWQLKNMAVPASIFFVKFRRKGLEQFERSEEETRQDHILLYSLHPQTIYEFILVASDGISNGTESDMITARTGGSVAGDEGLSRSPWFIGMVVALTLLLALMVIICMLVRERGGKYLVDGDDNDSEHDGVDQAFVEYIRADRSSRYDGGGSGLLPSDIQHPSIEASTPLDADSLACYESGEGISKGFGDDASFIGQYRTPASNWERPRRTTFATITTTTTAASEQHVAASNLSNNHNNNNSISDMS